MSDTLATVFSSGVDVEKLQSTRLQVVLPTYFAIC